MPDPSETQQVLDFVMLHKVFFASTGGTVVGFGFLVGRYVFDKQLSILNQENQLLEERLRKASDELDEKMKVLLEKSDPVAVAQIRGQKMAADRGAAFRFFISVAALLTLLLSGGCLYVINQLSIKGNQRYVEQGARQNELESDIKKIEMLVKPKISAGPPVKPKR
jgi:hypothetical protein